MYGKRTFYLMTDLQSWMSRAHETDETLAEKLGVSRVQVSRVRRRKCRPSLGLAVRLEGLTGIPASSFASSPQSEPAIGPPA